MRRNSQLPTPNSQRSGFLRILAVGFLLCCSGCGGGPAETPPKPPDEAWEALERAEDARDAGSAWLVTCAGSERPELRARAAVVMGRMLDLSHVDKLLVLAADGNGVVRRTSAWALGQFGFRATASDREKEIVERLKPLLSDSEESVRANAVEAVGKLAGVDAPAIASPLLRDPSARVRAEAALACFRWRRVLRNRGAKGELPALPPEALEGLIALAGDRNDDLRWRAALVLMDKRAADVLVRLLQDGNTWTRLFAVRSLQIAKAAEAAESIAACQQDGEYVVRAQAVAALAELGEADLISADLARDASFHVRAAVADAGRELDALAKDPSPSVRAAVLKARAKELKEKARPILAVALASRHWIDREAAVAAAATLGRDGISIIAIAQDDSSELVRAAAVAAAGQIEGSTALDIVKRALKSESLAERGTAVEALPNRKEREAMALAMAAYDACSDRKWIEVRETIVGVVAKSKEREATDWLGRVLASDPAPSVKAKAARELKERGIDAVEPPAEKPSVSPHAGLRFKSNPVVVLETTRGTMTIECCASEAPVHVANFVGLVKKGFYDGLSWHRVVPNFVIQGGDPLGNGWGDAGWSMRAEINEQRYARGALGMPRSEGLETGGCQLFITHVPTPQLDGLYTVYGRVVDGHAVIDEIERGDTIIQAYVRD